MVLKNNKYELIRQHSTSSKLRVSYPGINKKAILLTLVTITILSIFAITYTTYSLFKDRSSVNNRITTLNNFVSSVEHDLPRQVYISGYRAIFLFNRKIIDTGTYITDANGLLSELFFNGTLLGVKQDLMDDATFLSIETFLADNAKKINANLTLENPTIELSQDNPWDIKITFNATLLINDKGNLASWNRNISVSSLIPITNFNDPIYSVNTAGKVLNRINQTPYKIFVTDSDYTNLMNHFQNSLYRASTSAPSFIMRLQGNLSASPNGIESLVNPQMLADQGISAKYKSVVDYIYFSTSDPAKYTIPAVSNLILDDENNHLTAYNVSGVAVPA